MPIHKGMNVILSFILIFNLSASARKNDANLGLQLNDAIKAVSRTGMPKDSCEATPSLKAPSQLFHYICTNLEQNKMDIDTVLKQAGSLGGERLFENKAVVKIENYNYQKFTENFKNFWKINQEIPKIYSRTPKPAWDEELDDGKIKKEHQCEYVVNANDKTVQKMGFGEVSFVGLEHFYQVEQENYP